MEDIEIQKLKTLVEQVISFKPQLQHLIELIELCESVKRGWKIYEGDEQ